MVRPTQYAIEHRQSKRKRAQSTRGRAKMKADPVRYAKHLQQMRDWRKRNKDKTRVYRAEWEAKVKVTPALRKRTDDWFREWRNDNQDKVREIRRKQAARLRADPVRWQRVLDKQRVIYHAKKAQKATMQLDNVVQLEVVVQPEIQVKRDSNGMLTSNPIKSDITFDPFKPFDPAVRLFTDYELNERLKEETKRLQVVLQQWETRKCSRY